jgi:hypothetical protein
LATTARAQAAVAWCGGDEVTTNRVPEVEVSSPNQIHVVYATPSDGPDNFGALAPSIASDVAAIDAWWQGQDSTRTPRWDLYAFPGCTSRFGQLDIGFVRLPREGAFYSGDDGGRLDSDIAAAVSPGFTVKTLVYYDGGLNNPRVCGESRLAAQSGGRSGIAYVFLRSNCDLHVGDGGSAALTAAHELIHDMGAMPEQGPPHACPGDAGHPCDSSADILYPFLNPSFSLGTTLLDVGRDDYYGHNGSWWDTQDSQWLIHLPQFPLRTSVEGSGELTINVETYCAAGCTLTLDNGFDIRLAGVAADGWRFARWRGDCSGGEACILTMDGQKTVTAVFERAPQAVRVSVQGKGRVTSSPTGISCPGSCSHAFAAGAVVRLTARPARGRRFAGWSGDCTDRRPCTVRTDRVRSVRATFR